MASGKALLKTYIKQTHKDEIDELKSQNKQCKVSIDYEDLNQFLIDSYISVNLQYDYLK